MKSLKSYFTKKSAIASNLVQPAVSAYNKVAAAFFVATVTPYVALAAATDNAWNVGGNAAGLQDLNDKSAQAGTIVVNVFKLVMLCLLLWRIVMFIKDKKFVDLIYCGIAGALLGYAPKIINAFYTFGAS